MGEDEMDVSDNIQIVALKEKFLQKCFTIVEKGVEDGVFKMKDVAGCLGISSQVASKLVNPTSPRILTAFELFRMSVLVRRPVMEMIPLDLYLTVPELEDTHLCKALCAGTSDLPELRSLEEAYAQLPEGCRQRILVLVRTLKEQNSHDGKDNEKISR